MEHEKQFSLSKEKIACNSIKWHNASQYEFLMRFFSSLFSFFTYTIYIYCCVLPAFFGGSIAQNLNYRLQKPLLRYLHNNIIEKTFI